MASDHYPTTEAVIEALEPSYPVYCFRRGLLRRAARRFLDAFPGRVLYAVKCNPHPFVLRALYESGVRHFDTASLGEIAQIREMFSDGEAYFNHPVKTRAAVKTAHQVYGVRHFVIDHPAELRKIVDETGGHEVVILVRVATPEAKVSYHLSAKFGASPDAAVELLGMVRGEGLRAGMTFHVGSQCLNPAAYTMALAIVRDVLSAAKTEIEFLDVGGGFPAAYLGVDASPLEAYLAAIDAGLAGLKLRRDCVLMCEPGRALVADGCSLVIQIQLRKGDSLYINDGIYHSLSEMVTGPFRMPVRLIRPGGTPASELADFTIYGPTCDPIDVLPAQFRLPADAGEGDWIEIERLGAYSNALATRFNGFHPETFFEIDDVVAKPGASVGAGA